MKINKETYYPLLILTLIAISVFEALPAVEAARKTLPADFGNYDCFDALRNRPWYGQINTWLFFWLLSTPMILMQLGAEASKVKKAMTAFFAVIVSYTTLILTVHMRVDLRNAPFSHTEVFGSNSDPLNEYKYNCFDIASGGASEVFTLMFGWTPVLIYVGFWLLMRWACIRFKSNKP